MGESHENMKLLKNVEDEEFLVRLLTDLYSNRSFTGNIFIKELNFQFLLVKHLQHG